MRMYFLGVLILFSVRAMCVEICVVSPALSLAGAAYILFACHF